MRVSVYVGFGQLCLSMLYATTCGLALLPIHYLLTQLHPTAALSSRHVTAAN